MHKRVVLSVSTLLFVLLATVTWIVTDLHDRSFPAALNPTAIINLDFVESPLDDGEALAQLGELSDQLNLDLLKVTPDLTGNQQGQVFVAVGSDAVYPAQVTRFGSQPDSAVRDRSALANSFATGQYLLTGDPENIAELETWCQNNAVIAQSQGDGLIEVFRFLVNQDSFAVSMLAVIVLMTSLVIYWLSVKARGRALRVLSGVAYWRVHVEDLGGFLLPLAGAAVAVGAVASLLLAATQGAVFVGYYFLSYAVFVAIVMGTTATAALAISAWSAPNASLIASRLPAVATLRHVSSAVKALTFVVVLTSVAPAFHAIADARLIATQQAKWRSLSDQVAFTFSPGTSEAGLVALMPQVGAAVADAERARAVALAYTWTGEQAQGIDLEGEGPIALVNQRWIDLVIGDVDSEAVDVESLPGDFRDFLAESLPLWVRIPNDAANWTEWTTILRLSDPAGVALSSAGGGGLTFPAHAILVVVDRPAERFNDDFLTSIASSQNLVFGGLGPTEELLQANGLAGAIQLRLVAEEGVLAAQISEYIAWLRALSLFVLVAALVLSATISAFVTSLLNVRRDFPLRLAGRPWWEALASRVLGETVLGALILAVVAVTAGGGVDSLLVLGVGMLALCAAPLAHLATARWAFTHARSRRL